MSMEALLREGEAFARHFFPGYDCLIVVHRDTDNDHIHIAINSVRALPRPREEEWMMRGTDGQPLPCELEAGGKHQDSPTLRRAMNEWLLDYTREHGLTAKDNNAIADANREKRHGAKNEQMREALLGCARKCRSMPGLRRMLMEEYGMELTVRGQTVSVRHPDNQKFVRLKTLGLEPVDLFRILRRAENRYDDEWANSEKEELRRELELTADLIRKEGEAPTPPLQLTQEERVQLRDACHTATEAFWAEYRERQGAIQRKLDEKYQLRRVLKDAEWALDTRNRYKSITGSVHAARVLIKNDSRRWLEREIEELKEERRKLSERGEKFKARKEAAVGLMRQGGNSMGQCMAAIEGLQDMAESLCWENTGMLHRPAPQKEQTAPKKEHGLDR